MAALNDAHQHALHHNIYHFADCEESAKFLKPARSDCVHGVCMYRDPSTCTCKLYGLTHTLCTYTGVLKSRDCNLGARMVRVSDAGERTLARGVPGNRVVVKDRGLTD
jgi:hypothetical protein